jgi:hypothetical protein
MVVSCSWSVKPRGEFRHAAAKDARGTSLDAGVEPYNLKP